MKHYTFRSLYDALEKRGWEMKRIFLPYRYFECITDRAAAPLMFEVEIVTINEGTEDEEQVGRVREDVAQKVCGVTGASLDEFQEFHG